MSRTLEPTGTAAPLEPGATPPRPRPRRHWIGALAALAVAVLVYSQHRTTQPLVIGGAGAGTYATLVYERHYFYWVDPHGRRGVDTTFRVIYYSHEREPERMRAEARRIAPALWPFADSAGLGRLELKPSRPLFTEAFPLAVISHDVRYARRPDGAWTEVRGW